MCIGRDACMSGRAMVAPACGCGMPEESGEARETAGETAGPSAPRWHSAEAQQRVSRVGNSLLTVVSSLWCVYLLAQFFSTWDVTVHSRSATHWSILTATLVLGVEIGVLVMTGLLVFLVPRMIMTWTTTIVFEYVFGKGLWKQQVIIRDGRKIAREIAVSILKCVIKEANFVGATVVLLCLLSVSKILISSQPSPTASC